MDYSSIFKPDTLAKLNRQSADNLRTIKQEFNLMDQGAYLQLLQNVMAIEVPYKAQLEQLAVNMVEDLYPVIEEQGIKIDAGLTDMNGTRDELAEDISPEGRRRVINAITQGAALKGTFSFYLFKDHLDAIDPTLVSKYNEVMKRTFGVYDDDNIIAMMMTLLAQGVDLKGQAGGSSKVIIKEEAESGITIRARAICFPMLVHEIIKGLYELISLQGFKGTKDQNQQVVDKVDKLEHEPHDLRFGRQIFDALNDIYAESGYEDSRIREHFFVEIYQLEDEDFIEYVENAINGTLTPAEKRWTQQVLKEIQIDLKSDDYGQEGLDEIKVNNPNNIKISSSNVVRISQLPILDLKIGKYDLSKGRKGIKISPYSKQIDKRTLRRAKLVFDKLGINIESAYVGWMDLGGSFSYPSTYLKSSYNGHPIIIAQTQTEQPQAGQIYIYSENFKSGKAMRLPDGSNVWQDNSGIFADSNATKEQILSALKIEQ